MRRTRPVAVPLAMALVCACLLLSQRPGRADDAEDLDRLVQRLSSDDPAARELAATKLVALGDRAEQAVRERLGACQEEDLKARCVEVLRRIDEERLRAAALPPLRPVTLQLMDASLEDAAEAWKKQVGLPCSISAPAGATVTLSLDAVTPLEALEALCRSADAQWSLSMRGVDVFRPRDPREAPAEPTLQFARQSFFTRPQAFVRHYSVTATAVSLTRQTDFRSDTRLASLTATLRWTPGLAPDSVPLFVLTRVTDDQGRELADKAAATAKSSSAGQSLRHRYDGQFLQGFSLTYPAEDAKRLARVSGRASVRYRAARELLRFALPDETDGAARQAASTSVRLKSFAPGAGNAKLVLELVRGARPAAARADGANAEGPPFGFQDVTLVLHDGARSVPHSMSGSSTGERTEWSLTYALPDGAVAEAVELDCTTAYFDDDFEFELKDVPLPR
ncbi:MAG: hypothetical protein HYZ53_24595 [Planctomycetes bacterium]|nr:hypothetical protein [Planctomycetota bacterium]